MELWIGSWQVPVVRFAVVLAFVAAGAAIHFRGRVRHSFVRQLTDHSTFIAPYNVLAYLFSRVPNRPIQSTEDFAELQVLRDNWEVIRDEARALVEEGRIGVADSYNDIGFNSFFRRGWKRFYLKWYADFLPSAAKRCPRTVELLRQTPHVNAAMFTLMEPHCKLGKHRDPFAGSLRYHLGLLTPNSDSCFILIDGERRSWRDGQDLMFDETYIHEALNDTEETRVILFCDVERPLKTPIMRGINHLMCRYFMRGSRTRNEPGEPLGFMNRIFGALYRVRLLGKALKRWNKPTYYVVKFTLFGLLIFAFLA